jgi:hypothetical protein
VCLLPIDPEPNLANLLRPFFYKKQSLKTQKF